ncbi:acyl-CoA--sterol O-acyltransferase 1-like [Heracleum sosnowskyi]|uniref:Acyl-CoA--sterol O-acyltransferase 1-like n=1 Tax=Heracleum sosnowskyi TaxID=360622 RepID=A0AAD8I5F0_9APIA|nr:acyl-CoA--sterol O-acyltransferase 1-like [Heracleum sosnowskyi]
MEGEMYTFVMVWISVLACLCYSHTITKFFPKGTIRFLTIFPVLCLFIYLPLCLTSINLGCNSTFFISWLTNFKLLLFAFSTGPLHSDPPLSLTRFILLACLPIKIKQPNQEVLKNGPNQKSENYPFLEIAKNGQNNDLNGESKGYHVQDLPKKGHKSLSNYAIKFLLFAALIKVYDYRESIHPTLLWLLYCFHIYFVLELLLAMFAAIARSLMSLELEPQFDDPYLATSLQDFWGKRWNLMVSNILRPTVFVPVHHVSKILIGKKLAALPAVIATFFVSGLMHELIFYSYQRRKTNWQAMCFFMLHGVALALEIGIKKMVNGRFRLPRTVSRPLTLTFVIVTSFWLFFPPFLRGNIAEVKSCKETLAFIEFVKHGRLVSPSDLTCPYL